MLTLYLGARTLKYVSLQKEAFKLENSRKKMNSLEHHSSNLQRNWNLDTEQQKTAHLKATHT